MCSLNSINNEARASKSRQREAISATREKWETENAQVPPDLGLIAKIVKDKELGKEVKRCAYRR